MITKIDHIGVAVKALETSLPFWAEALGLEVSGIETVASEDVKVAFLRVGDASIELCEPTGTRSAVGRFLDKRGEAIHHLTLEVSDLPAMLDRLRERGVPIIGDDARPGSGGRPVAFVHPKAAGGVLVELVAARETRPDAVQLEPGSAVLLYLHQPQEKLWGVLRRLDAHGVLLEGIDLASFDDWVAQLESEETSVVGASVIFIPMTRLERILLDRSSGDLPSLAERFERRTGRTVQEVLRPT